MAGEPRTAREALLAPSTPKRKRNSWMDAVNELPRVKRREAERPAPDRLLTSAEVCELLRVSSRHLRRLAVPCVRFGRLVRYRRGDVFRWVEARRNSA
jgi:excisionase family DNA binding protein